MRPAVFKRPPAATGETFVSAAGWPANASPSRGRTVGLQYLSQHMLYRGSPWVLYLTDDTDLMYNDRPRILARMGLLISVPPTLGFGIALVIRR